MSGIAIVTGASRGIGVALVRALVEAGWRVHAVARDAGRLEAEYAAEIGAGAVLPHALDVTDRAAVEAFFASRFAGPGAGIDLLFNNAGRFASIAPVWDADPDTWRGDLDVNVQGVFLMCRFALPVMRRADRGIVINMDGGRPVSASAYASSKAAVVQFTRILADELKTDGSGVAVYAANPGLVKTDMTRLQAEDAVARRWLPGVGEALASGRTRAPEEVARKMVLLLPLMGPATSGQYFSPATPDGEFAPLPL